MQGRIIIVAIGIMLGGASAAAHDGSSPHPLPAVPEAVLTRPIGLVDGIGWAHDQVATTSADAQRFYDQGLSYLHNYVWIEAARSFNQALRHDPGLVLAYLGLSVAYEQLNQGGPVRDALARARDRAPADDHAQRHLLIRQRQIAAAGSPADAVLRLSYQREVDAALVAFPSDVELWLQRGMAESASAADRGQSGTASAVPFYLRALAIAPQAFAPHHYLTHAYENAGQIQSALDQGQIYARLAPAVPHARHMYGHNLRRVGRIEAAIAEFEAADRLETEYFARERLEPDNDWHYEHNLDLLGMSYQYTGQIRLAAPYLERGFGLPTMNLIQAVNKQAWPAFLRATNQPAAAVGAAHVLQAHTNPDVQAIGRIEAAHALLDGGQRPEAAVEANAAVAALKSATAGAGLASVPLRVLQGEFFLRTNQREKGRATLLEAIGQARQAQGPDEWARALFTLEATASAARNAGDWDFALIVARQMIEHDPFYGGSHYALALAAEHGGDGALAASEFLLAAKYWAHADPDLPGIADIRRRVAKSR